MNTALGKVLPVLRKVFDSDLYILFLCAAVLSGWIFGCWVAMIIVMLAVTAIGTICSVKLKPLISFLMLYTATMGNQTVTKTDIILILVFAILVVVALVFNLIFYKRDWALLHPKNVKGYTFAHILLIIPFLFAGLGSNVENKSASFVAAAIMFLITLLYVLLYVGASKEKSDFTGYALKCVFALSVIASVEFIISIVRIGNYDAIIANLLSKNFWIGWTGPNTTASVISMGIPCGFCLCLKKRKLNFLAVPACVIAVFIEFALVILSGSRGSILFSVVTLPPLLLYAMWKTESKPTYFTSVSVMFLLSMLLIVKFNEQINPVIMSILNKGMSSSGRVEYIYPEAVELFKQNPIFGGGWGYKLTNNMAGFPQPYLFHSTFYQFLANMGIVGVAFLAIFFIWRYLSVIPLRKNYAAVALTVSVFLFDAYSLIDTSFFNPSLFIITTLMLLAIELDMPKDKCLAFFGKNPLNLFKKKK